MFFYGLFVPMMMIKHFLALFSPFLMTFLLLCPPVVAKDQGASLVKDVGGVKSYLVETVERMQAAAQDFQEQANGYGALIEKYQGDYAQAYEADGEKIRDYLEAMKKDYMAMDSFGYETIEGIVAGVGSLEKYDVDLDSGVPASEGPDHVADVVFSLKTGEVIDREGSLFTYILEPALWGGNPRWYMEVPPEVKLPRAELLEAAAQEVQAKITALLADAQAWEPTSQDLFGAMIIMTPTLSEYFEEWKESRYAQDKSGLFQAVSRVSDMKGIMGSCAVMYQAVDREVAGKDPELARSISMGFQQILSFLDRLEAREQSEPLRLSVVEMDEMAEQAKTKTDKLVPQIEQAARLTDNLNS